MVVGDLRHAVIFDHYSKGHPPACEIDDDVMIDMYRERIYRHGALVIAGREEYMKMLLKLIDNPIKIETRRVVYRSLMGKTKSRGFFLGFLPPGTVIRRSTDAAPQRSCFKASGNGESTRSSTPRQ